MYPDGKTIILEGVSADTRYGGLCPGLMTRGALIDDSSLRGAVMSDSDPLKIESEEQEEILTQEASISEEDRQEILADIEDVVSKNRITVSDELFRITPLKHGFLLPTLINLLAILAVAAGFYFSARFFETRQETMNLEVNALASTEGRLIEELKRESEARMAQKEEEIGRIQEELSRIETQSRNLQQDFESTLARREAELRAELEVELAAEKNRLQALGINPDEIENRLRDFELQKQRELQSQLEEFRVKALAEVEEREKELEQAKEIARQILNEATAERESILQQAAAREAELASRFEAEREAFEEASSEAGLRLEEIARRQETENLITDQIIASYQTIMNRMTSREYEAALGGIETLRALMDDPRIDQLPRIAKRREVERFILNNLQVEIEDELNAETADTGGLVEAAQRLFNARAMVGRAETALSEGRNAEARELFQNAVSAFPALETAVERLERLEAAERRRRSLDFLNRGGEYLNSGETDQALASFRQAAVALTEENGDSLNEALGSFETTLRQTVRDSLASENETALAELRQRYEERITALEQGEEESAASGAGLRGELSAALAAVEGYEAELGSRNEEIAELNALIEEGRALLDEYRNRTEEAELALATVPATGGGSLSDEEISALTAGLRSRIEEQEERIGELSGKIQHSEQERADLRQRLESTELQLGAAERQLALKEQERQQLEKDLNTAVVELVDVVTSREGDDRYTSLARGYTPYRARIEGLLDGNADDYARAEEYLREFFGNEDVSRLFPDLGSYTFRIAEYRARRAQAEGRLEGRESAFQAAAQYAKLLAAKEYNAASRISEDSGGEEYYRRALERIRDLALTADSSAAAPDSTVRFLGTLAAIRDDSIVIEALAGTAPSAGTLLSIRRRDSSGQEMILAEGRVTSVEGTNIRGEITRSLGAGAEPRLMDLVYFSIE
jgi:hypothetical protein